MKGSAYKSTIAMVFKQRQDALDLRKLLRERASMIVERINASENVSDGALAFKELIEVYIELEILKYQYPGQREFDSEFYLDRSQETTTSFAFFINEDLLMVGDAVEKEVEKFIAEDGWQCSIEFIMKQVNSYHVSLSLI